MELIQKAEKYQEKKMPKKTKWQINNRKEGFEIYFDSLGVDSQKWVRIFNEKLGIVNGNGFKSLKPKHYLKV